ncbi:hypothetical protein EXM65_18390 [Clostridium botulinum]|uniref:Uncharacterized protein n=1 Tax=Clostridium botulinum TaxID=1491 RepID=A0A6M0ST50_CLOBO|nr:hypothetical protein [Clostridium botulinum]NFI54714.1 hypothetical protein [Clostridium botulinum]NFO48627.1 hypothetical protein [Clostridium botulinum]
MKAIVRDDIISLSSFVSAEFKYKCYLELLMKAGNYCFLDQVKRFIPSNQVILKGMTENNLISTENINKNYKYVYLSDTAMKYLCLKDSDKDYSDVEKNKISVVKVNKYPSEKQLFSSAYKFHLMVMGEELIDKVSILKSLEDYIYLKELKATKEKYNEWFKKNSEGIKKKKEELQSLSNELIDLKKIIYDINTDIFNAKPSNNESVELINKTISKYNSYFSDKENKRITKEKEINNFEIKFNIVVKKNAEIVIPQVEKAKKVFENMYNISKIIARIKENTLEFIIFDLGTFKTALGYIKLINKINALNLGYKNIKIIIYSYAEHRALNLNKEFLDAAKKKRGALNTLKNYNLRINEYDTGQRPDFYVNANKIYDSIPDFEVEVRPDFYYMEAYKEYVTKGEKSIKKKDRKVISDIIEKLKNE